MKTQMLDVVSGENGTTEIWNNNTELQLLSGEACLPEIGSSQVSSILSNLDNPEEDQTNHILKVPKRKRSADNATTKKAQEVITTGKEQTYITCQFCPFLTLCKQKIIDHQKLAHKNKKPSEIFELKCPVCANVFYHKLSLQAHLAYDHCVSDTHDIAAIIRVVLHSKKASIYKNVLPLVIEANKTPVITEGAKLAEDDVCEDGHENECDEPVKSETSMKCEAEVEVEEIKVLISPKSESDFKTINKCDLKNCKIRMKSTKLLKYHTESHFNSGFKCKECGEFFSYWRTLAGHLWRNHKLDMELFKCDHCDFRTASLSRLNTIHRLIHGTTYAFACNICNKSFKNGQQLRNHKDLHKNNSSEFKCNECEKKCSSKRMLKKHMDIVHKKLKPFLCTYCGYEGSTSSGLQMHIRRHTGEKPFKCKQCEYSTADHNSLRRHKLRHSGEKPYKCPHCHYQCIQTSTYKAHIKTKHPGLDKELLFSCILCQFKSINKQIYNAHMASQH